MKRLYEVKLDENNYILYANYGKNGDTELDLESMNVAYLNCYKLVDDKVIFDEEKLKTKTNEKAKAEEIARLKQELSNTDYEAIKYSEGWFTDEEYAPIKTMRESLREQIRALEGDNS